MPRTGKNISLRKDGRYEGRYIASRDENGKAKYASVYGKSYHEVEAKLVEIKASLNAEEKKDITTFSDAAREWLDDRRKHLSEATIDRYEYIINRYFISEFGERDVKMVTELQLNTFIAELADKEKHGDQAVSGTTLVSMRSISGAVLSFAENKNNNYAALEDMVKIEKDSYKPLTSDEIGRLAACAKYNRSPEMLGVMLSLFTGIGTGELCALSWDDFDLQRREIHITHMLYRIRNKDGGKKRTRLSVTNVRKSSVRTLVYPKELDDYVMKMFQKGTVFLTGEKEKYMEQRTFCNHLESVFKLYSLSGLTLQRVKKTHDDGLSDVRYLRDPFYRKQEGTKEQIAPQLNEKWLVKEMENDLLSLRKILGISSHDMGAAIGITEGDYKAIEAGEAKMDWDIFLSLLFFFKYNSKTESVVDALGLYPKALRDRIGIKVG